MKINMLLNRKSLVSFKGSIADDMINGACCVICGEYFFDEDLHEIYEHGHPTVCISCWSELTEEERSNHQKAVVPTI
jgi:hypothetical protein